MRNRFQEEEEMSHFHIDEFRFQFSMDEKTDAQAYCFIIIVSTFTA